MKRSPYFFMRRQAEKQLQTYTSASLVLLLLTVAIFAYGWRTPADNTHRMAILSNAKPAPDEVIELFEAAPVGAQAAELMQTLAESQTPAALISTKPTLPSEFSTLEPTAVLKDNTELTPLVFSGEVDDLYNPLNPARIFAEGYYTLYATFNYDGMEDGMVWAWVWRHNGEVVEGGEAVWEYGADGPGFVYLNPPEGFQPGEYTVDVWVNRELLARSAVTINSAAISAGN